jgi:hypothetical protein
MVEIARPAPVARRPRWGFVLAATVVAALAAVMLASPGARRAVADWLGIGGVRIGYGDPSDASRTPGAGLDLGHRVTLAEAAEAAGFELRIPAPDELGPPDQAYVAKSGAFVQVSFVYAATDDLPAAPGRAEGLVLVQFRGEPDRAYFEKVATVEAGIEPTTVAGAPGFWVEGAHELIYTGPDGTPFEERTRLSASTLVWELDGVTYRLESDLSREDARALAEGLR